MTAGPIYINITDDPTFIDVLESDTDTTVEIEVNDTPGPAGPINTLSIGDVSTLPAGSTATATITGTAPTQELNLGIPEGEPGIVQDIASPNGTLHVGGSTAHPTADVAYGTAANTAAEGNDTRIVNALQTTSDAGGDASGTFEDLTVTHLNGVEITNAPSVEGDALIATSTSTAEWAALTAVSARWGDGSDGNVTISSDTTLTRDMYYDNLTINAGKALNTNGWRVHVRNTLTGKSNAVCGATGNAGGNGGTATGAAGAAGASNSLAGGKAGGNGGTSNATAGGNQTGAMVANAGGAGGKSGGGALGGAGGTSITLMAASFNNPRTPMAAFDGLFANATGFAWPVGGAGGGGANGTTNVAGGGGGGGGGVAIINARIIVNSGSINSDGGVGGTGSSAGTGGGGGGGGGGGVCLVNTTAYSGAGTVTANGGAGGAAGAGSGVMTAGSPGSAGYAQLIVWTV